VPFQAFYLVRNLIVKSLNRRDFPGASYPERIIQFGEGNFLRAFVDWQIDLLNEHTDLNAGVTIVRPIDSDFPPSLSEQDGLYTTLIRGLNEQGEAVSDARLIRSVNREINVYRQYDEYLKLAHNPDIRFVFSNTTEAGISYHAGDRFEDAPAVSFPAKLTRLLFERYSHFDGAQDKGWVMIPCELIDYNGDALRELVLRYAREWNLAEGFIRWLNDANTFCSTLVDRIVTGYPRDEAEQIEQQLGYRDTFLDTAEHFYLFVIQGPKSLAQELRLDKLALNVLIVDDIKPYKARKVAILNGAHTALVPVAFMAGLDTVGEAMSDAQICAFVEKAIRDEIIPVLDLPKEELLSFAQAVTGRFRNPYIRHQLLSIALNGMTKFRTRILPQLLAAQQANGKLPARLTFALAALIAFYQGERGGESYPLQDDAHWLERYGQWWPAYRDGQMGVRSLVEQVLGDKAHWECDLLAVPGLVDQVTVNLEAILSKGMRDAVAPLC
jgi:tagaturonate reductase